MYGRREGDDRERSCGGRVADVRAGPLRYPERRDDHRRDKAGRPDRLRQPRVRAHHRLRLPGRNGAQPPFPAGRRLRPAGPRQSARGAQDAQRRCGVDGDLAQLQKGRRAVPQRALPRRGARRGRAHHPPHRGGKRRDAARAGGGEGPPPGAAPGRGRAGGRRRRPFGAGAVLEPRRRGALRLVGRGDGGPPRERGPGLRRTDGAGGRDLGRARVREELVRRVRRQAQGRHVLPRDGHQHAHLRRAGEAGGHHRRLHRRHRAQAGRGRPQEERGALSRRGAEHLRRHLHNRRQRHDPLPEPFFGAGARLQARGEGGYLRPGLRASRGRRAHEAGPCGRPGRHRHDRQEVRLPQPPQGRHLAPPRGHRGQPAGGPQRGGDRGQRPRRDRAQAGRGGAARAERAPPGPPRDGSGARGPARARGHARRRARPRRRAARRLRRLHLPGRTRGARRAPDGDVGRLRPVRGRPAHYKAGRGLRGEGVGERGAARGQRLRLLVGPQAGRGLRGPARGGGRADQVRPAGDGHADPGPHRGGASLR